MTTEGQQQTEYVSLTPLFDNNSMEAWIQALLKDRRCMDCKIELAECEGTTEFRGRLPQVDSAEDSIIFWHVGLAGYTAEGVAVYSLVERMK